MRRRSEGEGVFRVPIGASRPSSSRTRATSADKSPRAVHMSVKKCCKQFRHSFPFGRARRAPRYTLPVVRFPSGTRTLVGQDRTKCRAVERPAQGGSGAFDAASLVHVSRRGSLWCQESYLQFPLREKATEHG